MLFHLNRVPELSWLCWKTQDMLLRAPLFTGSSPGAASVVVPGKRVVEPTHIVGGGLLSR